VRVGREMVVRISFLSGNDFKFVTKIFTVAVVEGFAGFYPSFFAVFVYVTSDLRVEFIKCRFEKFPDKGFVVRCDGGAYKRFYVYVRGETFGNYDVVYCRLRVRVGVTTKRCRVVHESVN
jgi:hypothetical protein